MLGSILVILGARKARKSHSALPKLGQLNGLVWRGASGEGLPFKPPPRPPNSNHNVLNRTELCLAYAFGSVFL